MATGPLEIVANDQKVWSSTASDLEKSIKHWRRTVLLLAIAAAVLETLAAQIHMDYGTAAQVLGYVGAAAMAVSAVVQNQRLGRERIQAWIHSRAASEALKRELFLCRTSAKPYNIDNPADLLIDRRDSILAKADAYRKYAALVGAQKADPIGPLDAEHYLQERVQKQMDYFRDRAQRYTRAQGRLESVGFVLSILAALLGAAATVTKAQGYGAWVAVLTTITGTLAAYIAAQRYEQVATTYLSTADRLEGIVARWNPKTGTVAGLAEQCEAALATENQSWITGADETIAQQPPAPEK